MRYLSGFSLHIYVKYNTDLQEVINRKNRKSRKYECKPYLINTFTPNQKMLQGMIL